MQKFFVAALTLGGHFFFAALSFAADWEGWYINENGAGLEIHRAQSGDAEPPTWAVTFDFGQEDFSGDGVPKNGALALKRHPDLKGGPDPALGLVLTQAHDGDNLVRTAPAPAPHWGAKTAVGEYARLGLPEKKYRALLTGSHGFAAADHHLKAAWQALLAAVTSEERRKMYWDAHKEWLQKTRDKCVWNALIDAASDGHRIEALASAYAAVTEERAVWLKTLARQERDPRYVPSFRGRLHEWDRWARGDDGRSYIAFQPEGWRTSLWLCPDDQGRLANEANGLLEGEMDAYVLVTGRLEPRHGFDFTNGANNGLSVKNAEQKSLE